MKYLLSLIISGALVVSGFGQTRNVLVGTNNAVVQPTNFWSADAVNARSGLGLGTAATNPASAFQPSSLVLSNLASSNGVNLTNLRFTNVVGALSLTQGGTGATNAATARTNLELGWSALTNTDATNFRNAIGLGATNDVVFQNITASNASFRVYEGTNLIVELASDQDSYFGYAIDFLNTNARNETKNNLGLKHIVTTDQGISGWITDIYDDTNATNPIISVGGQAGVSLYGAILFGGTNASTNRAISRTSLGLGWSAITNTNTAGFNASLYGSGTNPVLYDTNGEVVSPTNFWQAAPIGTVQQNSVPATNSTNLAETARMLFLYSLGPAIVGVTNTITLPTNSSTFNGDVATITHLATNSSSVTAIRQLGASTNIITLNQVEESVRFIRKDNQWVFMDNISYIEPVYFSGTNAAANAAASRTNLGLGATNLVQFTQVDAQTFFVDEGAITFSGTAAETTRTNLGFGATNVVEFSDLTFSNQTISGAEGGGLKISYEDGVVSGANFSFQGTNVPSYDAAGASNTRVNLGIPLPALTNTDNANFQAAVFNTNAAPTPSVNFGDAVAWLEITVQTNGTNASFRIPLYEP
jgi:hypothetical protein